MGLSQTKRHMHKKVAGANCSLMVLVFLWNLVMIFFFFLKVEYHQRLKLVHIQGGNA